MVNKDRMDLLKDRYINAKTEKEREAIREEIRKSCDEDTFAVAEVSVAQIKESLSEIEAYLISKQMEDTLPRIS